MSEGSDPQPDVDALVAKLRARVEERRRQGVYPPRLEADLEAHFQRIVAHRTRPDLSEVHRRVAAVEAVSVFSPDRIETTSGVPGGAAVHRAMAKLQQRQTAGILAQLQEFADATRAALQAIVTAMEQPAGHLHPELIGEIDAVLDRMAAYERRLGGIAGGG